MGERLLCKQEVTGSSPVISTRDAAKTRVMHRPAPKRGGVPVRRVNGAA